MNAIWRPIPGFPAYEVTTRGQVRSVATRYVLTPRKGIVTLSRDGKAHRCAVRGLVAAAWAEEPGAPAAPAAVDHASEPDRTAVCFVMTAPTYKAELLNLAGEYDCLADECDGLYADCAKLQDMVATAEDQARQLTTTTERTRVVVEGLRAEIGMKDGKIAALTSEVDELRGEKARLLIENKSRQKANDSLEASNEFLREQIAEMTTTAARAAAKPRMVRTVPAQDKDAEIARLRGVVAEQEAELSLYRAAASF